MDKKLTEYLTNYQNNRITEALCRIAENTDWRDEDKAATKLIAARRALISAFKEVNRETIEADMFDEYSGRIGRCIPAKKKVCVIRGKQKKDE